MTSESNQQQNTPSIPAEEIYREQVLMAGYGLFSDLNDITYHHGGESLAFEVTLYGLGSTVESLTGIAERAQRIAATALEQLQQATASHAWLTSGAPRRCANCGNGIDVEADEWRICRDLPEHAWCHRFNPASTDADEDAERACLIEEDEYTAYCEDRDRTGGPRHDDVVELSFPDGRTVEGTWYVPGPGSPSVPIVLDGDEAEVTTTGATVRVIALGEDAEFGFGVWVPSLEDLARGEELAAALAAPVQPQNELDGDEL